MIVWRNRVVKFLFFGVIIMGTVVFEFQREFAQNYNLSKNI